MNKFILYVVLLFLYIILAKGISPTEFGITYIKSENSLKNDLKKTPSSVILVDMYNTGFLIKTYYHKYRYIYNFESFEEKTVRTSSHFYNKNKDNIGMSILRKLSLNSYETIPLPPGTLFLGDKSFGYWKKEKNTEKKYWSFFRSFKNLPHFFGLNNKKIYLEHYNEMKLMVKKNMPYYGLSKEFGTKGEYSSKVFTDYHNRKPQKVSIKDFILTYFKENYYNNY